MNLADLERQIAERADIAAIPDMSPAERANLLAEYQARVASLASEEKEALEKAEQAHNTRNEYAAFKDLSRTIRKHRSAQKSLEKLQQAIAKVEQPGDLQKEVRQARQSGEFASLTTLPPHSNKRKRTS